MISVAAELAGVHPQTLRAYEQKGLVTPQRTSGNTRMYSQADIERLELINELTSEGINLAGVIRILDLQGRLDERDQELDDLHRRVRRLADRVHELETRESVKLSRARIRHTPVAPSPFLSDGARHRAAAPLRRRANQRRTGSDNCTAECFPSRRTLGGVERNHMLEGQTYETR